MLVKMESNGSGSGLKFKVVSSTSGTSTPIRTETFSDFTKIKSVSIGIFQNASARSGFTCYGYLDDDDNFLKSTVSNNLDIFSISGNTITWQYLYGANYPMEFVVVGE